MKYQEAVNYLFECAPLFQNIGAGAYKEGLSNTHALDAHFGHPHKAYKTIHVAGTNGKGSVSHTLAAILQSMGMKVGLYTSPHLVDFRERIRVNGKMIEQSRVVEFVEKERAYFEPLHPSFFELATALAFKYFEEQRVDMAVVEVGLGGRLDCTNIITPVLSIITNISLDHTQFLGTTLQQIAAEKAGIIKPGIPVVIGECIAVPEIKAVFEHKAQENRSPIYFAEQEPFEDIPFELKGSYQTANKRTIQSAVRHLPFDTDERALREGMAKVCAMTSLMGRWQQISDKPRIICDTGHNEGGWQWIGRQLAEIQRLRMVVGMVSDKDVRHVLRLMPKHAEYYFTEASVRRAMPAKDFARLAAEEGLKGDCYPDVATAVGAALKQTSTDDTIFIGGSTFIVADYLQSLTPQTGCE